MLVCHEDIASFDRELEESTQGEAQAFVLTDMLADLFACLSVQRKR